MNMDGAETDVQGRVRVQIIQAGGSPLPVPGVVAADPATAVPNFGKYGWCEMNAFCPALGEENPKITLDDGTVIWGYQCWWQPIMRSQ
jgi:hypothetical protein